jgi:hypothetical protein
MKQNAVTNAYGCEHCGRTFARESTIARHLCEQKRRWDEQTRPANRIAYAAWTKFYQQFQPSKKDRDYRAFIASSYYGGFIKFGTYCVDVRVVNPMAYLDWSIAEKVALDNWTSDKNYSKFLMQYLQLEDNMDAVKRSIETLLKIAEEQNIRLEDVLRLHSANKVCHLVTQGHISAWLLFNCDSGTDFLGTLNADQLGMIYEYINIDKWKIKFKRDEDKVNQVKSLLREAGL